MLKLTKYKKTLDIKTSWVYPRNERLAYNLKDIELVKTKKQKQTKKLKTLY